MNTQRDATLDVLRGLAIAAMVFGHLAVEILVPPGIFYIEVLGGLAPALFVSISGMVAAQAAWRRGRSLRRPLLRGAELLAVAAALDLAFWRILPFTTVDILYLIALSLPVAHLVASRVPAPGRWALAAVFILAAPPLRAWLGYCDYPTEYDLQGWLLTEVDLPDGRVVVLGNQTSILNHWLVDGWFPVFPWLGISLLGVAAASLRWRGGDFHRFGLRSGLLPGALLVAAGVLLGWLRNDYELTPRHLYAGAFNPPAYGYLIGSVGVIALSLFLVDLRPRFAALRPLAVLGRHSLLIYLVHFPAIRLLALLLRERVSEAAYLALFVALLAALTLLAVGVEAAGRAWRRRREAASRA